MSKIRPKGTVYSKIYGNVVKHASNNNIKSEGKNEN